MFCKDWLDLTGIKSIGNIFLVLGSRIERANRRSGMEFGMDSTEAIGDGGCPLDSHSAHTTQTVSTKIMSLKNKRATVKRRITNTLKKFDSTVEQYGRKAIIRGYVNNLQEYLIEAKDLNDELVSVIPRTSTKPPWIGTRNNSKELKKLNWKLPRTLTKEQRKVLAD